MGYRKRSIYLAARFRDYKLMQEYKRMLEEDGHVVTSRWIQGTDGDEKPHEDCSPEEHALHAQRDIDDLCAADTFIYFTPAGRHGGCHVELGMALALQDMDVFMVGEPENVFHYHPYVARFATYEELRSVLGRACYAN